MSRQRKSTKEEGPKVPGYIVTFSDMVTLLLTFFVMLLSLASVQDPALFGVGRESFLRAIRGLGLGLFAGRSQKPDFGHIKVKYFIRTPEHVEVDRTIDAREEDVRRLFQQLSKSAKSVPSEIAARQTNFSVTDVRFGPGEATLSEQAKRSLTSISSGLQQDSESRAAKLYVLGLAPEEATEQQQWIVSAKRAQAAAEYLRGTFSAGPSWPVYSWGAGPGGDWVSQESPVSSESQILIAVLRPDE
ncbi:MAG: flagellar motor protein MotB [Planctomycetota bacterium]